MKSINFPHFLQVSVNEKRSTKEIIIELKNECVKPQDEVPRLEKRFYKLHPVGAKNGTGKTRAYSISVLENIDTFKGYEVSKFVYIFISYLFTMF